MHNPKRITHARVVTDVRRRLKLTRDELAERLGVSRQRVARWEQGMYAVPEEYLLRLNALLSEGTIA